MYLTKGGIQSEGTGGCLLIVKLRAVDWFYLSILNPFGQRTHYISIKFPLHKKSEYHWVCY